MFAVVFPLTPLLAYINNRFEGTVDLTKLGSCKRPKLYLRSTIGAWQTCLEIVSVISVLTNCFLLALISTKLVDYVPLAFHGILESELGRIMMMLAMEHVLLGIKVLMMCIIDDVPRNIQEEQARKLREDMENQAKQKIIIQLYEKQIEALKERVALLESTKVTGTFSY
jgi:anoctamin-8